MQVADIDHDLATAILTSEMRENQLSAGNLFVSNNSLVRSPVFTCEHVIRWLSYYTSIEGLSFSSFI